MGKVKAARVLPLTSSPTAYRPLISLFKSPSFKSTGYACAAGMGLPLLLLLLVAPLSLLVPFVHDGPQPSAPPPTPKIYQPPELPLCKSRTTRGASLLDLTQARAEARRAVSDGDWELVRSHHVLLLCDDTQGYDDEEGGRNSNVTLAAARLLALTYLHDPSSPLLVTAASAPMLQPLDALFTLPSNLDFGQAEKWKSWGQDEQQQQQQQEQQQEEQQQPELQELDGESTAAAATTRVVVLQTTRRRLKACTCPEAELASTEEQLLTWKADCDRRCSLLQEAEALLLANAASFTILSPAAAAAAATAAAEPQQCTTLSPLIEPKSTNGMQPCALPVLLTPVHARIQSSPILSFLYRRQGTDATVAGAAGAAAVATAAEKASQVPPVAFHPFAVAAAAATTRSLAATNLPVQLLPLRGTVASAAADVAEDDAAQVALANGSGDLAPRLLLSIPPIGTMRFTRYTVAEASLRFLFCSVPKVAHTSWLLWIREVLGLPKLKDFNDVHWIKKSGLSHAALFTPQPLASLFKSPEEHARNAAAAAAAPSFATAMANFMEGKPWSTAEAYVPREEAQLMQMLSLPDVLRVVMVRCPFSRVLSAYLNKHVQMHLQPDQHFLRDEYLQKFFGDSELLKSYLRDAPMLTFPQFVTLVEEAFSLSRATMDVHIAPQADLCGLHHIKYSLVGRFEDFADMAATVGRKLHHANTDALFDAGGQKHGTHASAQLSDYFDRETILRVQRIYEDDLTIPLNGITYSVPAELQRVFEPRGDANIRE